MTSQIPFTPLTPEALERLTLDEILAFEAATVAVANDQKPSLEVVATLVLTVHRLITEGAGESFTEWCVAWGGEDANDCAGRLEYDDEAEAREMPQWIVGGFVASRTVTASRWMNAPDEEPGTKTP